MNPFSVIIPAYNEGPIIASVIAAGAFYDLDAPVKRMGAMHVQIPFSPPLEDATVPTEQTVFEAAKSMCRHS